DSYFILLGLLRDEEFALAKSQIEQLLYEIEHYGTILNANRTYLLMRSQPPFLTPMILKLFEHTQDEEWLHSILPTIESYYYYWTVPPHLNQVTGLSRYFALGHGPAPEVIISERDEAGRTHYDRVREYYRTHEIEDYDVSLYYDSAGDRLTDLFYQGDRSMRESGLDPTNRFGPFSVDIIHYAPVCLNVLLYQMEQDLAHIHELLGHLDSVEQWRDRAANRHHLIDQFLWDEEAGLYFDYNFATGNRRRYEYLTTFYPLWTGIASPTQAQRVVDNLHLFEAPGGLRTSTRVTGNQWDAPFGWAPLQLIAIEGLHRYGYHQQAQRLTDKFIKLLVQDFERKGTLLEKYDVENCSSDVSDEIFFGYSSNEIGFGWTNGVFLELLAMFNK
ncbi:MAG: trehalase family glycosidase, partial [Microcystaceae cyanobacterium]